MERDVFATPLRRRRRSVPHVLLCVMLATACDETGSVQAPMPSAPTPLPESSRYRVSGIVMDAAHAAPIANATVVLRHAEGHLTAQTGGDGAYAFSFETSQPYARPSQNVPADILGLLVVRDGAYWTDVGRGRWTTVQMLPSSTKDIERNVRLRPVRTLTAGQSITLSVESDSSLAWDRDWDPWTFTSFDTLREEFLVSVERDGVLTIDARPEAGGVVATLTCGYVGCPSRQVQGTVSIAVQGRSPFYFSVEIPRASAPQRYEIQTSLR
jgi:hypothetical protein